MKLRIAFLCALACACGTKTPAKNAPTSPARFTRQLPWAEKGVWLKADTHTHSVFSDGKHLPDEVAAKAVEHGVQVLAITDHAHHSYRAASEEYFATVDAVRKSQPQLVVFGGIEWNIPPFRSREHATVLVHPSREKELGAFKRNYDDTQETKLELAGALAGLDALTTFSENGAAPIVLYNHPSRKAPTAMAAYERIRAWRKKNDVLTAMSGAPGHQKAQPEPGGYRYAVQTIHRWDPATAKVGSSWDTLLREGHDVWAARAPSDFHSVRGDDWPGEFAETWLWAAEPSPEAVLKAFRAGSFFGVHGHIARNVRLHVHAQGLRRAAIPGEAIEAAKGASVRLELTLDVPTKAWDGSQNQIDVVEFIAVTRDGARIAAKHSKPPYRTTLEVPAGGVVVRARGRRNQTQRGPLLFYTNPIRIAEKSL